MEFQEIHSFRGTDLAIQTCQVRTNARASENPARRVRNCSAQVSGWDSCDSLHTLLPYLPVKQADQAREWKFNYWCGLRSVDQLSTWTAGQFSSEAQRKETQRALDVGLWGWREGRGGCGQGSSAGRLVPLTPTGIIQLGTRWLISEADARRKLWVPASRCWKKQHCLCFQPESDPTLPSLHLWQQVFLSGWSSTFFPLLPLDLP